MDFWRRKLKFSRKDSFWQVIGFDFLMGEGVEQEIPTGLYLTVIEVTHHGIEIKKIFRYIGMFQ